jgi:putative addiction module component (TIGR02574 family)
MPSAVEELKPALAQLSERDRADLAYYLLRSLDAEEDVDAEDAWEAELARREEDITSGRAVCEPIDEVLARLREKYP